MNSMKLAIKVISAKIYGRKTLMQRFTSTVIQTPRRKTGLQCCIRYKQVGRNRQLHRAHNQNMYKHMFSDKFIGEVNVKFKKLFKKAGRKRKTVKYKLKNRSGKSKGKLKVSDKFLKDRPSGLTWGRMAMAMLRIAINFQVSQQNLKENPF